MSQKITRRSFFTAAGLLGAGIAASGMAGCAPAGNAAPAKAEGGEELSGTGSGATWIDELPYGKQDLQAEETLAFDLIIVGTGTSGMCAAMEAADAGANVCVIDKHNEIGGVAYGTEGAYGMNSTMQKDAGIVSPSIAEVVTEEMVYTNYRADSNFWADVFRASREDIDWLVEHGVAFDRADSYNGASTFKCFHWWPEGNGAHMGPAVKEYLSGKGNVTLMLNTEVIDLVNEEGAIKGVFAEDTDKRIVQILAPA